MVGRVEGRGRTGHVVGLVVLIAAGLFFALAGLGGVVGAAGSAAARAKAQESFGGDLALAIVSFATVVSVHNVWHSTRRGGYYTADVSALFQPPIAGRTSTVVHVPNRLDAPTGASYPILVDASDPGYAEFPGSPATKTVSWILMLVFAVIAGIFDTFFIRNMFRLWQHRQRLTLPPGVA